ncbi:MAG: tryptophan--tRNA ligase, partial [Thermomicrobiales bacterium]
MSDSQTPQRSRLLTGDRPTGPLHLGHLVGTLRNRVQLQHRHTCYFIIADLHMLTTKSAQGDIDKIDENARGLVLDAISAGLDPDSVTFYLQSGIPEIHELAGLLQSLITVSRLERLPALKDMARDSGQEMSFALLGYPVLQSADILSVHAQAVPVGKDNYAFVEIAREIARRFNSRYPGGSSDVFPIPEIIPGEVPVLVGTDGKRKMSKSLGNAIALRDSESEVRRKVKGMFTDPNRISADTPGTIEGNPVFSYLDTFGNDRATIQVMKDRYRAGTIGDAEVKNYLATVLNDVLDPIRARRQLFEASGFVDDLIERGTQ